MGVGLEQDSPHCYVPLSPRPLMEQFTQKNGFQPTCSSCRRGETVFSVSTQTTVMTIKPLTSLHFTLLLFRSRLSTQLKEEKKEKNPSLPIFIIIALPSVSLVSVRPDIAGTFSHCTSLKTTCQSRSSRRLNPGDFPRNLRRQVYCGRVHLQRVLTFVSSGVTLDCVQMLL